MKSKKYIIVNNRRFFGFITIGLVFLSIIFSLLFTFSSAHSSLHIPNYKEYYVAYGDSLWDISLKNAPQNYDVRKVVFDIKKLNNMKTSDIYDGDTIKIPIYKYNN